MSRAIEQRQRRIDSRVLVFLILVYMINTGRAARSELSDEGNNEFSFDELLNGAAGMFFKGAGNLLTSFVNQIGTQMDQCLFSCPNGNEPRVRKSYKPTYDGCGSYGFKLDFEKLNMPEFTACCNEHDICYGTCNRKKIACDDEFKSCLIKACSNLVSKAFKGTGVKGNFPEIILSNKVCEDSVTMMYNTVRKLGCPAYGSGQKKACLCD